MLEKQIAALNKEIQGLKDQISNLTANAGDQVNQLQAEIERLKQEHIETVSSM